MEAVEGELLKESDQSLVEQRRSELPYRDRRVSVDVRITANVARFVVRDEGPGFDVASIPDPGDEAMLEGEHGRGLALMQTFMDELTFNETGNEVTLLKRRDTGRDELEGTEC